MLSERSELASKTAISSVFFLFLLLSSLAVAAAQDSTSSSLVFSPSGLILVGKEGVDNVTGRLSFVGTANETIEVRLFSSDLIDNGSGKMIPSSELTLSSVQFNVSRNQQESIGVLATTRGVGVGTYRGTILVIANPVDANSTTMNIGVSVRIETTKTFFGSDLNWSFQSWLIISLIVLSIIGYLYAEFGPRFNTTAVILISITIGYIWVYTIVNFTFSELNTLISTVVVAPFLTYSANFLNEKRTQKNSRETASVTILKEGTKDDVELIRNIMGELVTHYASFNPYRYAKNGSQEKNAPPPSGKKVDFGIKPEGEDEILTPQILFNESGVLSREVWDKSCKQGRVADLPILRLEEYYDFIKLYNRYYSCAIMKTAEKTEKEFRDMVAKELFFEQFKAFRKAYAELETVLFANLSYDIGLFTRTNLSPLDTDYPRITRPLIEKLIDYDILETTEYPKHFFKITRPLIEKLIYYDISEGTEYPKHFFKKQKNEERIFKEFNDLCSDYKLEEGFWKEQLEKRKEKPTGAKGHAEGSVVKSKESANWEKFKEFRKAKAKIRIKDWKIDAKGLEQISKEIYGKDKIPKFYYEVENDFQEKYALLLKCAESLLSAAPLPPEFVDLEKTKTFLQEHAILKELLDELDKLEKLLDDKVITNEEFESRKKKILEKMSMRVLDKPRMLALFEELHRLSVLLQNKEITQDEYDKKKKKLMDKL